MDFIHRFALPKLIPIVERGERSGKHAINVQGPLQVINLMLENPRIPTGCLYHFFLSSFIQALHPNGAGPGNKGRKTMKAEAALEKFRCFTVCSRDPGVDDRVKSHGPPLALAKLLCRNVLVILFPVFDHRQLQEKSHLRSGKAHAWGVVHALSHGLD